MARRSKIAALALSVAVLVSVTSPASADSVSELQAKAKQIAKQKADLRDYGEALAEQANAARVELTQVQQDIATTQSKIGEQDANLAQLNKDVTNFAVKSYVYGDQTGGIGVLFSGAVTGDIAQKGGYSSVLVGQNADLSDQVKSAREDTDRLQQTLQQKRARQVQLAKDIDEKLAGANKSAADLVALESKVQGDLVVAVAEAERQRQEAERRAAEEAARRQAEQLRAQAAATARQQQQAAAASAAKAAQPKQSTGPQAVAQPATGTNGGGAGAGNQTAAPVATKAAPAPAPAPSFPSPAAGAPASVRYAYSQLGKPYVFASAGPDTFDCSGLTQQAWAQAGVYLPHNAAAQQSMLPAVPLDALQPGDLIFFGSPAHHEGIYVGGGQMIDAPHTGATVRLVPIYGGGLSGAGRPG